MFSPEEQRRMADEAYRQLLYIKEDEAKKTPLREWPLVKAAMAVDGGAPTYNDRQFLKQLHISAL